MKCSNQACKRELFNVTLEHREAKKMSGGRLPVKLVCAHCRKPVRAYITNEQMKKMTELMQSLADNQARMATIMATKPRKRGWIERIFKR